MKYQIGIGRAVFETEFEQELHIIRKFCQSMNKQGEIGFWEKKIDQPTASEAYVTTARAQYQRDGEIEIDDSAIVSKSDDGAYVEAWVWVDALDVEPKVSLSQECRANGYSSR